MRVDFFFCPMTGRGGGGEVKVEGKGVAIVGGVPTTR